MNRSGSTRRGKPFPEAPRPRLRRPRISILHGADLTTRQLALMEARSGYEGPCVELTSGVHGNEVGGIVVVQEIFARPRKRPLLAGRILGFPLLNPCGFEAGNRRIPSTAGIIRFRVHPGAQVAKGTPLASIHDVFGRRVELLRSANDAPVLGYSDLGLAVPGLPIIALARHDVSRSAEGASLHA